MIHNVDFVIRCLVTYNSLYFIVAIYNRTLTCAFPVQVLSEILPGILMKHKMRKMTNILKD